VQSRAWSLGRRIRTERWAYSEWDGDRAGAMLFDHNADPHELRNFAHDPPHAETVATLRKQLAQALISKP
jgi:arylsulfatase A-like enzyme